MPRTRATAVIQEPAPTLRRSARLEQASLSDHLDAFLVQGIPSDPIDEFMFESLVEDLDDPISVNEAMRSADASRWQQAMQDELTSLAENGTWVAADLPPGRKALQSKWVFKRKRDEHGNVVRFKGRVVAKGFQQKAGLDYNETFAPVAKATSIRAILALAASLDLELDQMDAVTAFLNGELNEEIYMAPPESLTIPTGKVLRLLRTIYGLKQAPREWYLMIDAFLRSLGFERVSAEHCVFVRQAKGNLVIIALYVDDQLMAATNRQELDDVKQALSARFKMKDLGPARYCLGLQIDRNRARRTLRISQSQYLRDVLARFGMQDCRPVHAPLDPNQTLSKADCPTTHADRTEMAKLPYRAVVGAVMFAMLMTRPDLAFAIGLLSRFCSNPGMPHWLAALRMLRYIRATLDVHLEYGLAPLTLETNLIGYSDADHAADLDMRRSVSGYVFLLAGGAISWRSARQALVALSTTEAEYIAGATACQELRWLRQLLEPLSIPMSLPTPLMGDNQGAIAISKNPEHHGRTKHIDIRHHVLREHVRLGTLTYDYVSTVDQLADLMTKALGPTRIRHLGTSMGLRGFKKSSGTSGSVADG